MSPVRARTPWLPPRWVVRLAWRIHRALYRGSGRRRGLWPPRSDKWGAMQLTTVGRRSGQERSVILAYLEDGPNLVTMAMNGWAEADPAWWLNLQAHPQARVELHDGSREVTARAAVGAERDRLWERYRALDANLDGYATRRSHTDVVVLEPLAPERDSTNTRN